MTLVRDFGCESVDHLHYPSDLAPHNYHMFTTMTKHFTDNRYHDYDKVVSPVEKFSFSKETKLISPMEYKPRNADGRCLSTAWRNILKNKPHLVTFHENILLSL